MGQTSERGKGEVKGLSLWQVQEILELGALSVPPWAENVGLSSFLPGCAHVPSFQQEVPLTQKSPASKGSKKEAHHHPSQTSAPTHSA